MDIKDELMGWLCSEPQVNEHYFVHCDSGVRWFWCLVLAIGYTDEKHPVQRKMFKGLLSLRCYPSIADFHQDRLRYFSPIRVGCPDRDWLRVWGENRVELFTGGMKSCFLSTPNYMDFEPVAPLTNYVYIR